MQSHIGSSLYQKKTKKFSYKKFTSQKEEDKDNKNINVKVHALYDFDLTIMITVEPRSFAFSIDSWTLQEHLSLFIFQFKLARF